MHGPNDVQPRMWHTATASKLMPGWTQVTMFGGCPKWEWGKSLEALPSLAKTTVLEFSKQNTCVALHATGCHFLFPWFSAFSVFIHYLTFFLRLTAPQVEIERCTYNFQICIRSSKHLHKPDYGSLDGEAIQCTWQILWLHAGYRVYKGHATNRTCLAFTFFTQHFPFHLGV